MSDSTIFTEPEHVERNMNHRREAFETQRGMTLLMLAVAFGLVNSYCPGITQSRRPFLLSVSDIDINDSIHDDDDEINAIGSSSSSSVCLDRTGIERVIHWKPASDSVPLRREKALVKSGVLLRRGEFCWLHGQRLNEVEKQCKTLGLTLNQGLLIRHQLLVSKVLNNTWKLEKEKDWIHRKFFRQQSSLLQLAEKLDLPPISILRTIIKDRVYNAYPSMLERDRKKIVKSIISEEMHHEFLTEWELQEMQIAKRFDKVGYTEETDPINFWEQAIYSFLDNHQINYVKEEEMRDQQQGSKKRVAATPDCLILDDCIINGHRVRWIDAKGFYGSGLKENWAFAKKLIKQIAKYESAFGESGAVIFKHGFSSKLGQTHPSTLFLDAGPLAGCLEPSSC